MTTFRFGVDISALNNMAVAMMQKGEIEMAKRTLKDALYILKLSRSRKTQTLSHDFVASLMQKSLHAATTILSNIPASSKFNFPHLETLETTDIQSLLLAINSNILNSSSCHAVLIRDPSRESANQVAFNRELGILLYNYGLACFLLATLAPKQCSTDGSSERYGSIARKALILSNSAFSMIILRCQDVSEDIESFFLSMLALSRTAMFLWWFKQHQQAKEAENAFQSLLMEIDQEYASILVSGKYFASPAA